MTFLGFISIFVLIYTTIGLIISYCWIRLFGEPGSDDAPIGVVFVFWPLTFWYYLISIIKTLALKHNEEAEEAAWRKKQ